MTWDSVISYSLACLFLPPGINLLLAVIGLSIYRRWRKTGLSLISISLVGLWLASTPMISNSLIARVETVQPLAMPQIKSLSTQAQDEIAIVVLSAGRLGAAVEFGGIDTVNGATLERIQYASWLHKKVAKPVLVSGGSSFNEATPEAVLMNNVMTTAFAVAPYWIESSGKNLEQQALFTSEILSNDEVNTIILVTHAWQMERAAKAFQATGLSVISAPTAYHSSNKFEHGLTAFLPHAKSLHQSHFALTELLHRVLD